MFNRKNNTKYRHIETEDKVILGIDKDMTDDDVSLLIINPMHTSIHGLFREIMQASISLRDRSILMNTIEDYALYARNSKCFNGRYWDILLDFVFAIDNKTLYDLAKDMSIIYEGYDAKSIFDTLDKLKQSKGNPREDSRKLIKILCYYCGVTEDILRTGNGFLYVFEKTDKYTFKAIQQYCNNHDTIEIKQMIKDITGKEDKDIREIRLQIGIEEDCIDENAEKIIRILLKKMYESRA